MQATEQDVHFSIIAFIKYTDFSITTNNNNIIISLSPQYTNATQWKLIDM